MATVVHSETAKAEREQRSGRTIFFDEDTRLRLAADDAFAWRSVTGILITIVTVGLLIAVAAVAVVAITT
jgi:hypothetical protein